MPSKNLGRQTQFIQGINGVAPGNNANVSLPVNQRYLKLNFRCSANNYSSTPTVKLPTAAGGTAATFTATVVNGTITAVAIATAGSAQTPGSYTAVVTDPTGTGAVITIVVAGGGTVTATPTVVIGATASPINPATMILQMQIKANAVNMRDITPGQIISICQANGYNPQIGELPIFFSEPWVKIIKDQNALSWDMFGQSSLQIQFTLASNIVNPQINGTMTFDYQRNERPISATLAASLNKTSSNGGVAWKQGDMAPFLNPITHHAFNWAGAAGRNDINILPFSYPIRRLWISGATPGNITQVEVYQDGNKILEGTVQDINNVYSDDGFQIGNTALPIIGAAGGPTPTTIPNGALVAYPFDAAFISDPDQRWFESLKCDSNFLLRVYSAIQQNLLIIQECMPGNYAG